MVESRPWSKAAMQQASETKSNVWEAGPRCGCSSVTNRHTWFEYMFLFQAATGKIMWNPNANQFGPNVSWAMHNICKMSIWKTDSLASLTHSVSSNLLHLGSTHNVPAGKNLTTRRHLTGAFVQKHTEALTVGHRTAMGVGTLTPEPVNSEAQETVTILNSDHSTFTCTSFENWTRWNSVLVRVYMCQRKSNTWHTCQTAG